MGLFSEYLGKPDRVVRNDDKAGTKFYGYDDKHTGETTFYNASTGELDHKCPTRQADNYRNQTRY